MIEYNEINFNGNKYNFAIYAINAKIFFTRRLFSVHDSLFFRPNAQITKETRNPFSKSNRFPNGSIRERSFLYDYRLVFGTTFHILKIFLIASGGNFANFFRKNGLFIYSKIEEFILYLNNNILFLLSIIFILF